MTAGGTGLGRAAAAALLAIAVALPGLSPWAPFGAGAAAAQQAPDAATASGAVLRVLDKTVGAVTDLDFLQGETARVGGLSVTLVECRYPSDNPAGDAFAHVAVHYRDAAAPIFDGWMIASSPALNALDHPRYDVWVLRCTTD